MNMAQSPDAAAAATGRRSVPRGPRPKKKKTKAELYHDEMRKLMSFLHNGRVYEPGHKWPRNQLLAVTPEKIMRYLLRKIYGDKNANFDETPPVHRRCRLPDRGMRARHRRWRAAAGSRGAHAEATRRRWRPNS